jgi:cytochrome P450
MNVFARWFARTRPAATIDFNAPAIARDPFPHYDALRAAGPVQFLAKHHSWIVLGFEQVQWAFTRPDLFSNQPYVAVDAVLLGADPPEHTAIRRIVSPWFSREAIERLGAFADEEARRLLKPAFDVVGDYAQPLSEAVATRLIGGDAEMDAGLRREGLSDAQARSLVHLFWAASTKTTERAIAACVLNLLRHADVRAAVERDHALLAPFIDEVLRLHPPEPLLRRMTTQAVEIGGVTVPERSTVYLALAAANRDPARHERPSELRLDRPKGGSLSFGHGIHHCIGATLGRMEVTAALRALLLHAPRFRAAEPLDQVRLAASMLELHVERLMIDAHGS